ncbi:hypothetical protein GCM10023211_01980 [Orbus sasakiae]|uniref:Uncharacterized protein n=1 Tax=Orbus sasakiae TaxID=1078475 RepID=A0ABP9MY94_9GAMM
MINKAKSQEIYSEFINGKVINDFITLDGQLQQNPLYEELFKHYDAIYQELYSNIGFELVMKPGFMFIRNMTNNDQLSDVALKIHALLTVLGRGVQIQGYEFEIMTTHEAGINEQLIKLIETEEMKEILIACEIKDPLEKAINNILVKRNIAYRNSKGSLVLSSAGKAFFEEVFGEL